MMNRFLPRPNFVVWTLAFGAVLSQLGAPPLVITIPWFVLWAALVLVVGLALPPLRRWMDGIDREIAASEARAERFPPTYEQPDISYQPARIGPTVVLSECER